MIPGNVDPRRPDKVQRYKPAVANGNGQGEDLSLDYMNILGQRSTTANEDDPNEQLNQPIANELQQQQTIGSAGGDVEVPNVIPTSPQYGVAIIGDSADTMATSDSAAALNVNVVDPMSKSDDATNSKDPLHSTPSRNDRFKVVKIASLEPFKRGRWKCMDYMDEAPPPPVKTSTQAPPGGAAPATVASAPTVYLQTQSLPQQQIQQMLLQGGQYYQPVVPQTQYFYGTAPPPGQYATTTYFAAAPVPPNTAYTLPNNFQNVQYVPANLIQTNHQGSAFVPTSFQQGQTYASPPPTVAQPMVNGHAYPPQPNDQSQQQQQQVTATATIPTQPVKSVILTNQQAPQQAPVSQQSAPPQSQQGAGVVQQTYQQPNQLSNVTQITGDSGGGDKNNPTNVYTNPQFDMNVNSLTALDGDALQGGAAETVENAANTVEQTTDNVDEPSKTNPVNAIDNKIELAMDLVKSHLMYTVREEVEVLKEKIAELMEKIQQLESENNYLRSQIPKNGSGAAPQMAPQSIAVTPAVTAVTSPSTASNSTTTTSTAGSATTTVASTQSVAPSGGDSSVVQ